MQTNKSLWEIFVPTVKSVDPPKYYSTKYHRIWDKKVREIAGGLTIMTPAKGQWISPTGELFTERMIPVRICCTDDEIEKIVDFTANYYNQQAIIYYKITDKINIKHFTANYGN